MTVEQRYFEEGVPVSKEKVNAVLLRLYNAYNQIEARQLSRMPARCFSGVITDRGGSLGDSIPPDDYEFGENGSINGSDIATLRDKVNLLTEKQQSYYSREYSHVETGGALHATTYVVDQLLEFPINTFGFDAPAGCRWEDAAIAWQISPREKSSGVYYPLFTIETNSPSQSDKWDINSYDSTSVAGGFPPPDPTSSFPTAYCNLYGQIHDAAPIVAAEPYWPCVPGSGGDVCPFVFRFRPQIAIGATAYGKLRMILSAYISYPGGVTGKDTMFVRDNTLYAAANQYEFRIDDINMRIDLTAFFIKK